MSHAFLNWMAFLWLACAAGYLALAIRTTEDRRQRICQRRGCRRRPAGTGCNHRQACDGSRAWDFHKED